MTKQRQSWGKKLDFVLATIGLAVGLGNVWRFPYLCYKSGGGAFLIPYFTTLIFVAIPLFIMEVAIGQYTRQGPIGAMWKVCPLFTGTGIGMCIITIFFGTCYNVVISWTVYYLYATIASIGTGTLPWESCGHPWNDPHTCWDNKTAVGPNYTQQATEQYFNFHVLEKSDGLHDIKGFTVHLVIALAISWMLIYFALFRGIRWTGKLVYFTALFPYVILFALLGWGSTLPGSKEGMLFFVRPRWEKLADYSVWVDAAIQCLNSIGIGFGSIIAFSSYNKFNNSLVMDCLIVATVNALTSLLSGFVIFSVLGYISTTSGADIENVVQQGPGLVFILYPLAFAELPGAHFWAAAFFFMLILLGIDSLGGIYVLELIIYYSSGISLMYLAFFECIAVVWFYGASNLSKNITEMTGRRPFVFLEICWWVIAPLLILVMWVFTLWGFAKPKVGNYKYPGWAEAIGWVTALLSVVPIPIFAAVTIIKAQGSFIQKLKFAIQSPMKHEDPHQVVDVDHVDTNGENSMVSAVSYSTSL